MFSVVMKAMFGVTYVVDKGMSYDQALKLFNYVLCSDEDYFDNLMVKTVEIVANGYSYSTVRV